MRFIEVKRRIPRLALCLFQSQMTTHLRLEKGFEKGFAFQPKISAELRVGYTRIHVPHDRLIHASAQIVAYGRCQMGIHAYTCNAHGYTRNIHGFPYDYTRVYSMYKTIMWSLYTLYTLYTQPSEKGPPGEQDCTKFSTIIVP